MGFWHSKTAHHQKPKLATFYSIVNTRWNTLVHNTKQIGVLKYATIWWNVDPSRSQGNIYAELTNMEFTITFLFLTRFTLPQISCILLFMRHWCIPCSLPFPPMLFIIIVCWLWKGCALSPYGINSRTYIVSASIFLMQGIPTVMFIH